MGLNLKKTDTSIRIGEVRFSYARVFEPYKQEGQETAKYSCCILVPKSNKEAIKLITDAVDAAAKVGAEKFWSNKVPATLKKPLRDGEDEHPDDPVYKGMMFFNCNNTRKPGVQVLDDGERYNADSDDDFYSGCWGAVTVNFYPYNKNGNKGVGASLGNLIKTRDDDRLSGGGESTEDSFGDL